MKLQTPVSSAVNTSTRFRIQNISSTREIMEHIEGHSQTKLALTKLELTMQELRSKMTKLRTY